MLWWRWNIRRDYRGGDDWGDGSLALDKGFTTAGLLGILGTTSIIWVVSKTFCAVADVSCSLGTTTPLGLLDFGKGFTTGSAFGASGTAALNGALPDALAAVTVVSRYLGTATPAGVLAAAKVSQQAQP